MAKGTPTAPRYKPGGGTGRQGSIMGNQTSRQAGGGARTVTTKAIKQREPDPKHEIKRDPKLWKRVQTPQGYWKWEKRKTGEGVKPPSVRARDEKRAKQPPAVKYATKKTKPKSPTRSSKKGGPGTRRRSVGAAGGGRK